MIINIKKLSSDAIIPTLANKGDAGLDITATSIEITDKYIQYGTSLAMEIPVGYKGCIYPRSSISNTNLTLCNSVGILDSSFRGEIFIRFDKRDHDVLDGIYKVGDRVAQLVIEKVLDVNFRVVTKLDDTSRGTGGFGSSDKEVNFNSDIPMSNYKLSEL